MSKNMKDCPDFDSWLGKNECISESDGLCTNDDKPCPYIVAVKPPFSLRQTELKEWQERNFPPSLYDDLNREQLVERIRILELSIGMSEEVGELSHIILKASQKIREGISGKINKDLVADGFADTVIYGTQLLSKLGIDAEEAIQKTIDSVLKRDWANNRKDADKNEPMPMVPKKAIMKPINLAYHGECVGKNQIGDDHPCEKVRRLGIVYARAEMSTFRDCWVFYQCVNVPSELPPYLSILE